MDFYSIQFRLCSLARAVAIEFGMLSLHPSARTRVQREAAAAIKFTLGEDTIEARGGRTANKS